MKQRIIIFDGPDGNGKTEMAKELSKRTGIPYFKNETEWSAFRKSSQSSDFINMLRYADPYFLQFLQQTEASVIIDRAYPSEWVYSKEFGRDSDNDALAASDAAYASLGALIIVPWRTTYNCGDKHNDVITPNVRRNLDTLYNRFCSWTKCQVIRINVDDEDLNREMNYIMQYMQLLQKC